MHADLVTVARRFDFVREVGPNSGAFVEFIQRFTGNRPGDSWCASFFSLMTNIAYHGQPPVKRSAVCQDILVECRAKGYMVGQPKPNDVFFRLRADGTAEHMGLITGAGDPAAIGNIYGIAGNTSFSGQSSNGTGVYEHALLGSLSDYLFARLP